MINTWVGIESAYYRLISEGITIDSIDVPTKRIVVTTEKSAEEVKTQLEKTGKAVSGVRVR